MHIHRLIHINSPPFSQRGEICSICRYRSHLANIISNTRFHHNKHFRIFVQSRWASSCFRRWWHSRLWVEWIMRRNAAGLFTEVGGDAVAFGVEEGANSHLPTGIHVTAHDKLRLFCGIFALPPEFHLAIATLPVHLQARHRSLAGGNLHHHRNDLLEPFCRRLSYLSLLIPLHRLQSI